MRGHGIPAPPTLELSKAAIVLHRGPGQFRCYVRSENPPPSRVHNPGGGRPPYISGGIPERENAHNTVIRGQAGGLGGVGLSSDSGTHPMAPQNLGHSRHGEIDLYGGMGV